MRHDQQAGLRRMRTRNAPGGTPIDNTGAALSGGPFGRFGSGKDPRLDLEMAVGFVSTPGLEAQAALSTRRRGRLMALGTAS
jgi:hypothetical protein